MVKQGFEKYGLSKIEAGTSTENIGLQKVLEKNGFRLVGKEDEIMKVNGK